MIKRLIVCLVAGFGAPAFAQAPATQPVGDATPITLHLENESPESAFNRLAEQAHVRYEYNSPNMWRNAQDVTINVSFDKAPFWQVFQALSANLSIVPFSWENGVMTLGHDDGAWNRRPAVLVGPLRVSASSASVRRAIFIAHMPTHMSLSTVSIEVAAEPTSSMMFLSDIRFPTVLDQKGRSIAVEPTPGFVNNSFSRGRASLDLRFNPAADVTSISVLKTRFNAVAARTQTLEIPDIQQANKLTREVGDTKLSITYHTLADGGFSVELQADSKSGDAAAWARLGQAFGSSSVQVLDASGTALRSAGWGSGNTPTRSTRTFNFRLAPAPSGAPDKLVWQVPIGLQDVPVTAEFKDLVLP